MQNDIPKEILAGQPILASFLNGMVQSIRSRTPQAGVGTSIAHNRDGFIISSTDTVVGDLDTATFPFEPVFLIEDDVTILQVAPSYVINGSMNIIPSFEGVPLWELDNDEYEFPIKSLIDGDYQMWLELQGTKAKITVDTAPPTQAEGITYTHLASFTIEDNTPKSIDSFSQTGLTLDRLVLPWVPVFFEEPVEGEDPVIKFKITQGAVLQVVDGSETEPTLDDDYAPAEGDIYYCKLTVDYTGTPTYATVEQATDPETVPYDQEAETDGEYYFRLFEIKGDADNGWYAVQAQSSHILWYDAAPSEGTTKDFHFYDHTGTTFSTLTNAQAFTGWDDTVGNWSLKFAVSGGVIVSYTATSLTVDRWDAVGDSQTYYQLPLVVGYKVVCDGGSWDAVIQCVSGDGVAILNKIG